MFILGCFFLIVFVKSDEQNKARFNSAMARKGAMKWKNYK